MESILITGKTGLFTNEALENIAKTYHVLLTLEERADRRGELPGNVSLFRTDSSDADYRKIFESCQIAAVWYVSSCADAGRPRDESAKLVGILRLCRRYLIRRMIVLTEGTDFTNYRELGKDSGTEIAAVRLPLLSGSGLKNGRINRIFDALQKKKNIVFNGDRLDEVSLLPFGELAALLVRMTSESWFRGGVFCVNGEKGDLSDIRDILLSIQPDASVGYVKEGENHPEDRNSAYFRIPRTNPLFCDGSLEEMYRFPVNADWGEELTSRYEEYMDSTLDEPGWKKQAKAFVQGSGRILSTVLDIAVFFFIAEYLARITSESVYFKIVDVRLLFVILMGMMHGLVGGMAAAFLECVVLVLRYNEIGISVLLLFYNVENWIPFVYYLTAGVISGYSSQKNAQEKRAISAQNELIRRKYIFLGEAYRACSADRKGLRTQILSEKDSYSKLYGAFQDMSQRTPEAVCVEGVKVLRRLLENDSVSLYEMDASQRGSQGFRKAGILSCCVEGSRRQAISSADCPAMMKTVLSGETWKNTSFSEDSPMYASLISYRRSIKRGSAPREIELLVTVENAFGEQMSAWYMNRFSILCGFLQEALDHASLREQTL